MGEEDRALDWLTTACQERTPQMGFLRYVESGNQWDSIRDEPRFKEILRCSADSLIGESSQPGG